MHRRLLHAGILLLALTPGMQSQSPQPSPREIDLEKIGYPARCDYLFQDKDAYEKRHVEFLDSERLLISFPLHTSACDKNNQPPAEKYRSVIIDTAGRLLHSFDWLPGENVQAGPDGHLLMSSGREIRILDSDFSILQRIAWEDPERKQMQQNAWRLIIAPSRHGFAVEDRYPPFPIAYFEGNPATQTVASDSCWPAAVTDGGFACADNGKEQLDIHLSNGERNLHDRLLRTTGAAVLPDPQTVLLLTDKRRLYLLTPSGAEKKIAELRWLVPGLNSGNSGFRWDLASGPAQRVLFYSHGVRVPITDTSGVGYYLRVAVVDVASKAIVFRAQYPIDSDVAISPDGHLLAVRTNARLTLRSLP